MIPSERELNNRSKFEYIDRDWGELIKGTKAELLTLGIGVNVAFPGEPGAPKRKVETADPRGFSVEITPLDVNENRFYASISFPGFKCFWEVNQEWKPFATGVVRRESYCFDEFMGTGQDLAKVGIVNIHELPGQTGMPRSTVNMFADGTIPTDATRKTRDLLRNPGCKCIKKAHSKKFTVYLYVSDEISDKRRAREDEWNHLLRLKPRPPRLAVARHTDAQQQQRTRAHLRLVW